MSLHKGRKLNWYNSMRIDSYRDILWDAILGGGIAETYPLPYRRFRPAQAAAPGTRSFAALVGAAKRIIHQCPEYDRTGAVLPFGQHPL